MSELNQNKESNETVANNSFTWDDLLEALNNLPPEQRTKQVCISIEDESIFRKVEGLQTIPEDIYVNNDNNEDCGDLETLKDVYGKDFKLEDFHIATPKGTPFLWDGF